MSEVKRYDTECGYGCSHGSYELSDGPWVMWEDYAILKAEVERLRKAGDAMLLALWLGVDEYSKEQKEKAEEEWNAANREQGCLVNPIKVAQYLPKPPTKEGKQS